MLSVYAIACITLIGVVNKVDTSMAIAMVAGSMAAANAYQKRPTSSTGQVSSKVSE
jgi:hypothetical protein